MAYKHLVPSTIKRVFLLGPSHHFYSKRCLLSTASVYDTPLGACCGGSWQQESLQHTGVVLPWGSNTERTGVGPQYIWCCDTHVLCTARLLEVDPDVYAQHTLNAAALCHDHPCTHTRTCTGPLEIDADVYAQLTATGKFDSCDLDADEAEHSLELHTPYIARVMQV
jgi:predicted class III extradiol MEMO1 family dioxygenase